MNPFLFLHSMMPSATTIFPLLLFTELLTTSTTHATPLQKNQTASQPITIFPATAQNLPSHVQFESDSSLLPPILPPYGLDGPKIDIVNASVFNWWYFDAVDSTDPRVSLVVTLFAASSDAFPYLAPSPEGKVLTAYLWASFPNGTVFAEYVTAEIATVVALGDGSKGDWDPTGFSWEGAGDMSRYEVRIESGEMDVSGRMELGSVCSLSPLSPFLLLFICDTYVSA